MKCPQEKAGGYAAVTIIVGFLLGLLLAVILGLATGLNGAMSGAMSGGYRTSDSTFTPDNGSALGALAAMGKRAEEASKKMDQAQKSGDTNAQAAAAGQMIGMPRTTMEVSRNGAIGIQVSNARATYRNPQGSGELDLEITDTGGAKGFMALAGFAGIEEDKQTQTGYDKTYRQNGRLVHEEWNNSGSGEYTVILGDRFVVAVKGSGVANIDAIKAALAGVNLAGLEALKNQGVKNG